MHLDINLTYNEQEKNITIKEKPRRVRCVQRHKPSSLSIAELYLYNGGQLLYRQKRFCYLLIIIDNSNFVSADSFQCRHQL